MKDRIAKQAYDRGYDAGLRAHTEAEYVAVNPYKPTRSPRSYTRHDYWQMGCDDGFTGHVRRMTQGEANDIAWEIAKKVAAIETRNERSWSTYTCPICDHQGDLDEHYDGCPVPMARTLVGDQRKERAA